MSFTFYSLFFKNLPSCLPKYCHASGCDVLIRKYKEGRNLYWGVNWTDKNSSNTDSDSENIPPNNGNRYSGKWAEGYRFYDIWIFNLPYIIYTKLAKKLNAHTNTDNVFKYHQI